MPFRVGLVERDQWLACMAQAMTEVGVPEGLQSKLKASFFQTADWMRNQAES
jgi:hemoglobin